MRMIDIILKKRAKEELTKEEIQFFITGYVRGTIPDYQVSALLMAIIFNSMTKSEINMLTEAMLYSGETVDLTSISGVKVDKHSTGGVGDKTSLVLGPMVASCGAKLAKMSGRGLGHTGGTLDKLESIPGFSISLSTEQFLNQVRNCGLAIIGQTGDLVPADKKLYSLRDVTGTVDSIPLIASSIMSKKLASGSDTILLDIKFGNGAFMKTIEDARDLARTMVDIGNHFGRDTRAEITDMNEPLGKAVGNNLEVKEAVLTLLGQGPKDLEELCLHSGATMLLQAKICHTREEAVKLLQEKIANGAAFEKLCDMVRYQGGDESFIRDLSKFSVAAYSHDIIASEEGYISSIDALEIGLSSMRLGGGRETKDDVIDMAAGIMLNKKVGDKISKGEVLATLYTEKKDYKDEISIIGKSFVIVASPVKVSSVIIESIE